MEETIQKLIYSSNLIPVDRMGAVKNFVRELQHKLDASLCEIQQLKAKVQELQKEGRVTNGHRTSHLTEESRV